MAQKRRIWIMSNGDKSLQLIKCCGQTRKEIAGWYGVDIKTVRKPDSYVADILYFVEGSPSLKLYPNNCVTRIGERVSNKKGRKKIICKNIQKNK